MSQQEIRVPDFSKRLTTERGRIEHNNPGPGERTSIGPEDRALLMERVRTALTSASEPAKVPEWDAEGAAALGEQIKNDPKLAYIKAAIENSITLTPAEMAAATVVDTTASSPVDSTATAPAEPNPTTDLVSESPESSAPESTQPPATTITLKSLKDAPSQDSGWIENV